MNTNKLFIAYYSELQSSNYFITFLTIGLAQIVITEAKHMVISYLIDWSDENYNCCENIGKKWDLEYREGCGKGKRGLRPSRRGNVG